MIVRLSGAHLMACYDNRVLSAFVWLDKRSRKAINWSRAIKGNHRKLWIPKTIRDYWRLKAIKVWLSNHQAIRVWISDYPEDDRKSEAFDSENPESFDQKQNSQIKREKLAGSGRSSICSSNQRRLPDKLSSLIEHKVLLNAAGKLATRFLFALHRLRHNPLETLRGLAIRAGVMDSIIWTSVED